MIILRDPASVDRISDSAMRALVEQRFTDICAGQPYDYDEHGYAVVVEPGDTVAALEEESSCPILRNFFDDASFGDPEFSPCFEYLQEHAGCYEMVFISNDSGFGIDFFIPKSPGIDPELLKLCVQYAEPAPAPAPDPELTKP